jgi:hypothetical protein
MSTLTHNEEANASSGECHVHLIHVSDEAQVLPTPSVCRIGFNQVARHGTHGAEDHVVPLAAY